MEHVGSYAGIKRTNKIAVLEVEAIESVAGLLCIHHILVDNKCGALGVVGDALADLAVGGSAGEQGAVGRAQ
jgi:hypothetical protein